MINTVVSNQNQDFQSVIVDRRSNYNPKIAVYPNLKSIDVKVSIDVKSVYDLIQNSSKYHSYKTKADLPVAYFSIINFNGNKALANAESHTGLIVIDIDKKDNPDRDMQVLKSELTQDSYSYLVFTSPSGGLKVVYKTAITDFNHHIQYFLSINKYLEDNYANLVIDGSGKNANRSCYLPEDKSCYLNLNSNVYSLSEEEINKLTSSIQKHSKNSKTKTNSKIDYINMNDDDYYNHIKDLIEKRTGLGTYNIIFNNLRYKDDIESIVGNPVRFSVLRLAETLLIQYTTRIDEAYFKEDANKTLDIRTIEGYEDGLFFTDYYFKKDSIIKEGHRERTLYNLAVKTIFNNPFAHPLAVYEELYRINELFCEDPNPITNPKPDDAEVRGIVNEAFHRYVNGLIDFTGVLKKRKGNIPKPKYIFHSRYNSNDKFTKLRNALEAYWKPYKDEWRVKFNQSLASLKDGKKITQKRIAKEMGVSDRSIRRNAKELWGAVEAYNRSLKLFK